MGNQIEAVHNKKYRTDVVEWWMIFKKHASTCTDQSASFCCHLNAGGHKNLNVRPFLKSKTKLKHVSTEWGALGQGMCIVGMVR